MTSVAAGSVGAWLAATEREARAGRTGRARRAPGSAVAVVGRGNASTSTAAATGNQESGRERCSVGARQSANVGRATPSTAAIEPDNLASAVEGCSKWATHPTNFNEQRR
jgi:hypothetical protein